MEAILRQYELTRRLILSLNDRPMTMAEIANANRAASLMDDAARLIKSDMLTDGVLRVRQAGTLARTIKAQQDTRAASSHRKKP